MKSFLIFIKLINCVMQFLNKIQVFINKELTLIIEDITRIAFDNVCSFTLSFSHILN